MHRVEPKAEDLFAQALARPEHERASFLDGACGSDVTLKERILALLRAHAGPESLLAGAPATTRDVVAVEEKPGDWIARYKLLQKIGEGGCGVVWMAEQEEPVRRRVALKIIKLGMDTKAVVARFEAERQALAMMDHPNIAKVHDAGATETGRPYFVMELVRGIPITKYCDENHLNPTARLELFIKVCHAVQHAHQKGIIHRDLKPSNILVTVNDGAPTPKIIDFGIAKATQGKLTDATVFTAFEQFIGTPVYMSPEQAEMSSLDIDTRSDIYSLGVLLYELLTGRPPFDAKAFAEAGVDQVRKQIREVEPQTPSRRLHTLDDEERTTIARLRNTAISQLSVMLRGDLDWIVMRCLEKDRTRRYDTANGLAMDIQRYLRNEPVVARPPSTGYLLQKLVRRHKLAFVAGSLVAGTVVSGMVVSVWQRTLAVKARGEAEQARSEAEKLVGRFLLDEFYADLAPTIPVKTMAKLAEQAVAYYDRLPAGLVTRETQRNRAMALMRQGRALSAQGAAGEWPPVIERAITELEKLRSQGDTAEETALGLAIALHVRANAKWHAWEMGAIDDERAVTLLRPFATVSGASRRARLEFANILNWWSTHQADEAGIAACQEARSVLAGLGALDFRDLAAASAYGDVADTQANLELSLGRLDEAERLGRECGTLAEKILTIRPGDLRAMQVRAWAHEKLVKVEARRFHPKRALELAGKCAQAYDDCVRLDPLDAITWSHRLLSRQLLVQALWLQGRPSEAEANLRAAIAMFREAPRGNNARWRVPFLWLELVAITARRGDRNSAESALAETTGVWEMLHQQGPAASVRRLATEEYLEQSRRRLRLSFHEYAEVYGMAQAGLARIEALARRPDLPAGRMAEIHGLLRSARVDVTRASLQLGRFTEAEHAARAAATGAQGDGTYVNLETTRAETRTLLAFALARQGRGEDARVALLPALAVYRNLQKNGAEGLDFDRDLAFCLYVQAIAFADDSAGRTERAAALAEAARLLDRLTDEARALREVRELMALIDAERTRQNDKR